MNRTSFVLSLGAIGFMLMMVVGLYLSATRQLPMLIDASVVPAACGSLGRPLVPAPPRHKYDYHMGAKRSGEIV